jgi:hypothetical protein
MFSPWEETKALLRLNAEAEARKGWAALTEYNLRNQLARRGHYDPNQPRVLAGHPDGGQWTSDGDTFDPERIRLAGLGRMPIPPTRPPRGRERNPIIKEVAKALAKGGIVLAKVYALAPWLPTEESRTHSAIEALGDHCVVCYQEQGLWK